MQGSHNVQLLVTAACGYTCVTCTYNVFGNRHRDYPWATKGEHSIFRFIVKAIRTAKAYIYIEDQYAQYVQEYRVEIEKALQRGVQIVVLVNAGADLAVQQCKSSQCAPTDRPSPTLLQSGSSRFITLSA